jgi:hypothetical protein
MCWRPVTAEFALALADKGGGDACEGNGLRSFVPTAQTGDREWPLS